MTTIENRKFDGANILVIDNQDGNRAALDPIFQSEGYAAITVTEEHEALTVMNETDFAAILISLPRPDLRGVEIARLIRKNKRHPSTPIVFITDTENHSLMKQPEIGFVDYLFKPLHPAIVKAKLYFLVELYHRTRQLQASEERNRLLIDGTRDYAIFMLDPSGIITSWNKGAERIKGYKAYEIIGKHFSTFYTESDILRNHPQNELRMAIETGRYEEEGQRLRKDGSIFWANVVITPLYDTDGVLKGFSKVTRDITERKIAEAEKRLIEELERSNRELQQFAYISSHDLKEPLRVITSFSDILQKHYHGSLDENATEYLGFIRSSAVRMHDLLEDLLSYSKLSNPEFKLTSADCNRVLQEAIENLHTRIAETHAKIEIDNLPTVNGNTVQLRQVFQNLISNALKFKGTEAPVVKVNSHLADNEWVISVEDNGIGFDPKMAEEIFNVFRRLHSRDQYPGTGMGLAICKRIVERHGGRIWAKSKPGQGSTFYFTLPVLKRLSTDAESKGLAKDFDRENDKQETMA